MSRFLLVTAAVLTAEGTLWALGRIVGVLT